MRELKRQTDARASGPTLVPPISSLSNRYSSRTAVPEAGKTKAAFSASARHWLDAWRESLSSSRRMSDLLAGATTAAVALPLNVALAIACGLPASVGLIAGAVGGAIAAIFGGSMLQVTGPAAALATLVFALVQRWGPAGAAAGAIAVGVMQLLISATRASTWMNRVPEAVLAGFTTGVGVKLLDQQIPLLLDVDHTVSALITSLGDPVWLKEVHWFAVVSGLLVIVAMLGFAKHPKVPAAIGGLAIATGISTYLGWDIHRVGAIPSTLPTMSLPAIVGSEWFELAMACLPLAILATAESLLSARAVDRMTQTKKPHESNLEAFGQGLANIGSGIFGGMPVSGVIVRSSVNVLSGGKTRFASLIHALLLLSAPVMAAKWIGIIPIAALAGLLCLVGYRLVEIKTLVHVAKESRLGALAFVAAAAGVVSGHLMLGLIAAILFAGLGEYLQIRKTKRAKTAFETPNLPAGVRARIGLVKKDAFKKAAPSVFREPEENWQAHVEHAPLIHPTAFVHPNASLIGRVVIGPFVHVATEAALRADEGTPFYIGERTNIQDGVVLHALKKKWVQVGGKEWAIYIGDRCSLAHQALVHGPCFIGDDTFIGFKAVVHDSVVNRGCSIGIGAIVVGVEIPEGRHVPHGMLVDTQEKAQALPIALPQHHHFNEDVVEVNHGLVEAYRGDWLETKITASAKTRRF